MKIFEIPKQSITIDQILRNKYHYLHMLNFDDFNFQFSEIEKTLKRFRFNKRNYILCLVKLLTSVRLERCILN